MNLVSIRKEVNRYEKKLTMVIASLSLLAAGLVVAGQTRAAENNTPLRAKAGYTCPLNGETLPCPACCPAK